VAVVIRLKRIGAKKKPHYRIVVADNKSPRDGRFIEELGHYNPTTDPASIEVNGERAKWWLGKGAKASDTVKSILKKQGVK